MLGRVGMRARFGSRFPIFCCLVLTMLGGCDRRTPAPTGAVGIPAPRAVIRISQIGTCQGLSPDGQPSGVASSFPGNTERVYLFFRLEGSTSLVIEIRWFLDGELIGNQEQIAPPGLTTTWVGKEGDAPLPAGSYRVEVWAFDGQILMADTCFVILPGSGETPGVSLSPSMAP